MMFIAVFPFHQMKHLQGESLDLIQHVKMREVKDDVQIEFGQSLVLKVLGDGHKYLQSV